MDQALTDTLKQILGSQAVVVLTQIAVGLGLVYAIDKFFKLVEEKLSDDTKLEIAVWLLGAKVGQTVESWSLRTRHVASGHTTTEKEEVAMQYRLTGLCAGGAGDAGCAERNHQPEHAAEHHRCHVRRGIVNTRPRRRGRASCALNRTRRASRLYAYGSRSGHPARSPIVRIAFPGGPLPDAPWAAHQLLPTNCDQTVERLPACAKISPISATIKKTSCLPTGIPEAAACNSSVCNFVHDFRPQ